MWFITVLVWTNEHNCVYPLQIGFAVQIVFSFSFSKGGLAFYSLLVTLNDIILDIYHDANFFYGVSPRWLISLLWSGSIQKNKYNANRRG